MPASTSAATCGSSGRPHTAYARSRLCHASRVSRPGAMRGVVTSRTTRAVTTQGCGGLLGRGRGGGGGRGGVAARLDPVGRLLTDGEVDGPLGGLHDGAVLGVDADVGLLEVGAVGGDVGGRHLLRLDE